MKEVIEEAFVKAMVPFLGVVEKDLMEAFDEVIEEAFEQII